MRTVDDFRFKEVLNYVDTSKNKFDDFVKKYNLMSDNDLERGNDVFIHCPFHKDNTPSLAYNETKGIWSCFSCGEGGNFIRLFYLYETRVLGNQHSFSSFVNGLLKRDIEMQQALGFFSIYKENEISFQTLKKLDKFTPNLMVRPSTSYLELADKMKSHNASLAEIKFAILSMQEGINANSILTSLYSSETNDNDPDGVVYDLDDMRGDNDE